MNIHEALKRRREAAERQKINRRIQAAQRRAIEEQAETIDELNRENEFRAGMRHAQSSFLFGQ